MSHTVALAALVVLASAQAAAGGALADWLAVQDEAARCPALVVLNGDHPARVDEALRLYREGVGREVWLTSDPRSGTGGHDAGTQSNARRLINRDVPWAAIYVVPGEATGTRAELEAVATALRSRHLPCAVLITSPLHARRVKITWQRVVGDSPGGVVRHATAATYVGWRTEVKELGLSILAFIGLPR